jgi:hypothetical protein
VDTLDEFSSRMAFLSDVTKFEGPGTFFNIVGPTIKTGQPIDNPTGGNAAAAQ